VGKIYGYDIVDDIDDIRATLGVCPQHDILWKDLTAREHLQLFSKLKGLSGQEVEDEVQDKLELMGLANVRILISFFLN